MKVSGLVAMIGGMASATAAPAVAFESSVRLLLEKYCFECHGVKRTKAEVNLISFKTERDLARDQALWLNVLTQVRSHAMPPVKSSQPTEAERQLLTAWLDQAMDAMDARAPRNPGRAPLHRLNRVEYNNTIHDLLIGLDLRPADAFPVDDTAHGFDNVAEGLTLSSLLLEKYLDAAERVLAKVIVTDGPLTLLQQRVECASLPGARVTNGTAELALERELSMTVDAPQDGDYAVSVQASQRGAGNEPATLVLKVDGVDTKLWPIMGENRPVALHGFVPLTKGAHRIGLRHTWHVALPKEKSPPDARLFVKSIEFTGPANVAAHRQIFFVEPSPKLRDREAASRVVDRFATRAFRRPVEAGELERLLKLYDQQRRSGKSHVESVRLALLSVLVSPQFLFRIEHDAAVKDASGAVRLNDWELASRLSYWLWSSMPDEELFRLATAKQLADPGVFRQQVTRMLADPKACALAENFAGQWLGLRKLDSVAPDPQLFPGFKPPLRQAMAAEGLLFFETVMREDRSILEFMHTDWTFVNEDLARHYGIRDVTGGQMRRVALTNSVRGGVMTMAAVLTVTSHPTRTSAVKRGKWVLEEILGTPPPPPPPQVPELEVPPKGQPPATTLRERLERHRADPKCFGCHVRMDALGLGLENFDAIGRWRDKEGNRKIEPAGTLPGGESFASAGELKQVLAKHPEEFARNLVEKMFVYALGRGLERYDRREVKRVTEALARSEWRFSALVTEIAMSYPFTHRLANEPAKTKSQTVKQP